MGEKIAKATAQVRRNRAGKSVQSRNSLQSKRLQCSSSGLHNCTVCSCCAVQCNSLRESTLRGLHNCAPLRGGSGAVQCAHFPARTYGEADIKPYGQDHTPERDQIRPDGFGRTEPRERDRYMYDPNETCCSCEHFRRYQEQAICGECRRAPYRVDRNGKDRWREVWDYSWCCGYVRRQDKATRDGSELAAEPSLDEWLTNHRARWADQLEDWSTVQRKDPPRSTQRATGPVSIVALALPNKGHTGALRNPGPAPSEGIVYSQSWLLLTVS